MKDKKMFYALLIVFIFIISIGLSYAYFNVNSSVNGDRNDMKATVGKLSILYTDGPQIIASEIQPGWSETKTITIENNGTYEAYYALAWDSLVNEITNDEMVLSATCTSNIDTCEDIQTVPITSNELAVGIKILEGEIHTYEITFTFIETSSTQNYNQGKAFYGTLIVEPSDETFTLAGLLLDENGDPLGGTTVEVHSKVRIGVTDINGEFEINNIEVGNHEIFVKNASEEIIATDTMTLSSGESSSVSGTNIVGETDNKIVNLAIKLNNSNSINHMASYPRLTVILNGSDTAQIFKERYMAGTVITLTPPTKENHTFEGWSVSGSGSSINGNDLTIGTGDTILTANFELFASLTVNMNGGTSGQTFDTYYEPNSSLVLTPPTKSNHTFDGWSVTGSGSSVNGNTLTIGIGSTTLTANFTIHPTLTVNMNGGSSGQTFNTYYVPGSTMTLTTPTKTNYTFNGWSVSGTGSSVIGNTLTIGTGNTTLTANFTIYPTLTVNMNGGSSGQTFNTYYAPNSTVTLTTPTLANNSFTGWSVSGTGSSVVGSTLTIGTGNTTLTANFLAFSAMFTYTGSSTIIDDGNGNFRIKLLTDGYFTANINMLVDIFLVGGGTGGNVGGTGTSSNSGGGGAGGLTTTVSSITLPLGQQYTIDIGAGGGSSSVGYNTTGFGQTAYTGTVNVSKYKGNNGGSGGGGGAQGYTGAGSGGSNGANGNAGNWAAGTGQGTTTREFGEVTGTLYSGGGGGGGGPYSTSPQGAAGGSGGGATGGNRQGGVGSSAAANTGGGGGGGGAKDGAAGGAGGSGGSGIIVIRNHR